MLWREHLPGVRSPGYQSYLVTNLHHDLGQDSPLLCLSFYPYTMKPMVELIFHSLFWSMRVSESLLCARSSAGCWDIVTNRSSLVPARGAIRTSRKAKARTALQCSNLSLKFMSCDMGLPRVPWGSWNREGLVAWGQSHLLPTVFLGPPTPLPAPQLPASEGTPAHPPRLPPPGSRSGWKCPALTPTLAAILQETYLQLSPCCLFW